MKIPGGDRARIEPEKVRDYLLSLEHPVGRFKAAFLSKLGFSRAEWPVLAARLRDIAISGDAVLGQVSHFGQKYEVRGTLIGPSGRSAYFVTVWILLKNEDFPRFVTAYPGDGQ